MTRIQTYGLSALLVTAACAAGTSTVDRSALFLSAAPAPQGRMCNPAANPATLPSADAVVDSAAVARGAKPGAGEPGGYALFSLQFDNQGRVVAFHTIESNLAPDRKTIIEQLTLNRVRVQPAGDPWSIRLKVASDSTTRLQVGRSELCPAVVNGPLDLVTSTSTVSSSSSSSRGGRGRGGASAPTGSESVAMPHFSVLVDTTGRLLDLKLTQSSGQNDLDQRAESGLREKGFRPTLLDGAPIIAWTRWPLSER